MDSRIVCLEWVWVSVVPRPLEKWLRKKQSGSDVDETFL